MAQFSEVKTCDYPEQEDVLTSFFHSGTAGSGERMGLTFRAFAKEKQEKSEGVEAGGCVNQTTRYLTDILSFTIHIRPIK